MNLVASLELQLHWNFREGIKHEVNPLNSVMALITQDNQKVKSPYIKLQFRQIIARKVVLYLKIARCSAHRYSIINTIVCSLTYIICRFAICQVLLNALTLVAWP